jgi:hypothetical protein
MDTKYAIWYNGDGDNPGCYVGPDGLLCAWRRGAEVFESRESADAEIKRQGWINTTDSNRPGTAYVCEWVAG